MNKVFKKLKNNKIAKTAVVLVSSVIVLSIILLLLIPDHLSATKFKLFFRKYYAHYTVLDDYINLSYNTEKVLEGKKTGSGYIVCHGEDAQKAFEYCFEGSEKYEITQAALAKHIESFSMMPNDLWVYMFVFKDSSDAKEFYDYYSGSLMYRSVEQGEEKGYSYTVCYKKDRMGCYLEDDTVLILEGYGGRRIFDKLCRKWGIKSPYEPSRDK